MRFLRSQTAAALAVVVAYAASAAAADATLPAAASKKIDFAKDIEPILARNCHSCHGPKQQQGGLRLDSKSRAMAGGDSGVALNPGRSGESELVLRAAGLDPDTIMPPEGKRLSPEEVGLLRAWIDQGAIWPDKPGDDATRSAHWSFQPVRRPQIPVVKEKGWVRNPIDAFVLSKLEIESVKPSPEADRNTLIRRLHLDLLGLPPTPAEVEAFVKDTRPDAYERLVDRLLASPHYGERMARHWLDLARYADSDGYEKDLPRPHAWRYRHWVIEAFNRDLPFDQFTVEQIAGDLLPNATVDQKLATGFHRNTLTNREGGVDQEEFRVKATVDRTNTIGTVWLGLTLGCAQCHSHKYDPITQREYYGMFAFFNSVNEVDIPAPLPTESAAYAKAKAAFDEKNAQLKAAAAAIEPELPARQAEWESKLKAGGAIKQWQPLRPASYASEGGAEFTLLPDQSLLAGGYSSDKDSYTVVVNTKLAGITGFRLEVLNDGKLPQQGPGRSEGGNFVLSELSVKAAPVGDPTKAKPVVLQNPAAEFSQDKFPVTEAIDGKPATGWAIGGGPEGRPVNRAAVFQTKEAVGLAGGTTLTFTFKQLHGTKHTLGRIRLCATDAPAAEIAQLMPDKVAEIVALPAAKRTKDQSAELARFYRTIDPDLVARVKAVNEHANSAPQAPATMGQTIAQVPKPRQTNVLLRGDFLSPGATVDPHVASVLNPLPKASDPSRMEFARWLVDPANPLTSRVTVNRLWLHMFGRGIVATVDDFGTQGEPPSHPELLDWLAAEFPARGWSTKAMLKLIVTSATYRQSANTRPELDERDPKNVWLARQNRFRIPAEVVRDLYLATSGLLTPTIGGPSVRPPLPAGVADLGYANSVKWTESTGPDKYRRGLYIFFQRTVPYPMLVTFDAPDSNVTCARREQSNTPLQSLTLLNDPVFFECAQALGHRLVATPGETTAQRIDRLFELALARKPTATEQSRLAAYHQYQLKLCKENLKAAEELAGKPRPAGVDVAEAATWVAIARVVLNLDEFVTRE